MRRLWALVLAVLLLSACAAPEEEPEVDWGGRINSRKRRYISIAFAVWLIDKQGRKGCRSRTEYPLEAAEILLPVKIPIRQRQEVLTGNARQPTEGHCIRIQTGRVDALQDRPPGLV